MRRRRRCSPAVRGGMGRAVGAGRQPLVAARVGPAGPARGRGVPRVDRRRCSACAPARSCSPPAARRPTTSRSRACTGRGGGHAACRRILASAIEHHAVLDPVQWLAEEQEAEVDWLPVDALGRVDLDAVAAGPAPIPTPSRCAPSCGRTTRSAPSSRSARSRRCAASTASRSTPTPCRRSATSRSTSARSGADAVTISSHKIGGPFGVGALIVDPRMALTPVLHGGGQEREVRSGTLDAPAIAAFAVAVEHAVSGSPSGRRRLAALRESLVRGVLEAVPDAILNGDPGTGADERLPGNAHLSFPGCEGDLLLMLLDAAGRRLLDRIGLHRRHPRAQPRAARDGRRRVASRGRRCASASARARRRPTSTPSLAALPGCRRAGPPGRVPRRPGSADMRVIAAMSGGVDSSVAAARMVDAGHEVVRRPPGAVAHRLGRPHRVARLLHPRGRPRRPARRRPARHPVLRVGPVRAVPRRRDRRLRRRVPQRPHPQPLPALQREDQVLRRARPRAGAWTSTRWRPATTRGSSTAPTGRSCTAPSTRPRTSRTCWACSPPSSWLTRRSRSATTSRTVVRDEAERRGLLVARKPDSHDICFIPDGDTAALRPVPGRRGSRRHRRRDHGRGARPGTRAPTPSRSASAAGSTCGCPAADGAPRYVVDVDIATSTVRVGPAELLDVDVIEGIRVVWAGPAVGGEPVAVLAQVRAHGMPVPARARMEGDGSSSTWTSRSGDWPPARPSSSTTAPA